MGSIMTWFNSQGIWITVFASLISISIVVFQFQIASAETNERKVHANESIHIHVWTKPCRTHDPLILKHYYRSVHSTVVQEYGTALISLARRDKKLTELELPCLPHFPLPLLAGDMVSFWLLLLTLRFVLFCKSEWELSCLLLLIGSSAFGVGKL